MLGRGLSKNAARPALRRKRLPIAWAPKEANGLQGPMAVTHGAAQREVFATGPRPVGRKSHIAHLAAEIGSAFGMAIRGLTTRREGIEGGLISRS